MPKLSGLRNSMKTFTRKVSRKFGGKGGDRKSLLKKTSSKSFSDITKSTSSKTSSKSRNPFNGMTNNNKRGIGQRAAEYKSKGRSVQNYIPSAHDKAPAKPSLLKRTMDRFKPTKKNGSNQPSAPDAPHNYLEASDEQLAQWHKEKWAPTLKKNLAERRRKNLIPTHINSLKRQMGGGGVDPSMMYMMMQSKQDADQAEAERKQAAKDAADNKAVETRQNFFG